MTFVIAVAGKGGVGKSTLAALLVQALAKRSGEIVLAVDADPNSNLGDKLGAKIERTIGEIREDLLSRSEDISAGGNKHETVLYQLRLALTEGEGFDLVTMGRSEGQGCYCYINNLLRTYLDSIMEKYPYVVIDNEAGMEHLSRRTCRRMDLLLVVSDVSKIEITTAARLLDLAGKMGIEIGSSVLVVDRARGELDPRLKEQAEGAGFREVLIVPYDDEVERASIDGVPLTSLKEDGPAREGVGRLLKVIERLP